MTDHWQGDSPWWKPEPCGRPTKTTGKPCQQFRYSRYAYACHQHETPTMRRLTVLRKEAFEDGVRYAQGEADWEFRKLRMKIEALKARLREDVDDAD